MLATETRTGSTFETERARAVEVTTMIGDSVVAVNHLAGPRGGRVTQATKAMLACAAIALLCSASAFGHGVSVARDNARAFKHWTEVEKLPAIEFRPVRMSPLWDVLAIGGLATGLGLVCAALWRAQNERRSTSFRMGRGPGLELQTDEAPAGVASFPVVAPEGDGFVLNWAPGMKGELFEGGQIVPLASVPGGRPIARGAKARLQNGTTTLLVHGVDPTAHRVGGAAMDGRLVSFAAISAIAHAAMLLVLFMIPDDTRGIAIDEDEESKRIVRISNKPMEEAKQEEMQAETPDEKQDPGGGGEAMAGPSGTMGTADSKNKDGRFKLEKGPEVAITKEKAVDRATSAGPLGLLRSAEGRAMMASVLSDREIGGGWDDETIRGGLNGVAYRDAYGNDGYGRFGTGLGGDGTNPHTVGLPGGRYDTIGGGNGPGRGWYKGPGNGGPFKRERAPKLPPTVGPVVSVGDLDKSIIRKKVREKIDMIQHCYDRELVAKPTLQGTLNMQFTIDKTGKIIAIQARGLDDENVATCVSNIFRSIQFPSGFIVEVTSYPLRFRAPGT
jgi:hypothetical protein